MPSRWSLLGALAIVACAAAPAAVSPRSVETPRDAESSPIDSTAGPIAEPSDVRAPAPGFIAAEAPLGIARCDDYLALYKACEPQLRPEIAAGDRRAYAAERGWLEYLRDTPEGAELSVACDQMHRALLQRFGGGGSCADPVPPLR